MTAGAVLLLGTTVLIAARLGPWPGVLLIQWVFGRGETEVAAKLEKYLPSDDLDLPQARQAFSEIGTFVCKAVGLTSKP